MPPGSWRVGGWGATGQVRPGVSFAQAGAPPRGAGGEAGGGSLLGAPDVAPEPEPEPVVPAFDPFATTTAPFDPFATDPNRPAKPASIAVESAVVALPLAQVAEAPPVAAPSDAARAFLAAVGAQDMRITDEQSLLVECLSGRLAGAQQCQRIAR